MVYGGLVQSYFERENSRSSQERLKHIKNKHQGRFSNFVEILRALRRNLAIISDQLTKL